MRWATTQIVFMASAAAVPTLAQEVRVNQYTAGNEEPHGVAAWSGGARFLWQTAGEFCSGDAVLRTVNSRGAFVTDDTSAFSPCGPRPFDVAVDPNGAFLVAGGTGLGPPDIIVRLFDSGGTAITGDLPVNQNNSGNWPRAAYLSSGRYAVVWQDDASATIRGRIVMPDGSMPAPEVTIGPGFFWPDAADGPAGTFAVVWKVVVNPATSQAMVQVFDDVTFVPVSAATVANETQCRGAVPYVCGGPGGFLVTWACYPPGMDGDVMARYFDAAGAPLGSEFLVNTAYTVNSQDPEACSMDAAGNAVIVWDSDFEDGSFTTVMARRYDATGQPLGPIFRVNGTTYGDQQLAVASMTPGGGFFVGWWADQDFPTYSGSVFMRRYAFPLSLALAPGSGSANPPTVLISKPDGTTPAVTIPAYGASGYGANVGAGDIDGGATWEVLTGPGPSPTYGPQVKAFRADGTSVQKINFYAYGTLKYGVRAAGGDVDGDGMAEILTAPGEGAVFGPHIRGFNFDTTSLSPINKISFFAFQTLKWGARVAGGDIDGEGIPEILTAPGPGAVFAPQIRGFNYDNATLTGIGKVNFYAFSTGKYGATVGASDVESDGTGGYGDGYQEILAGVGPDPDPTLAAKARLFDYDNAAVAQKYEIQPYTTLYGMSVAGGDVDAGDTEEVVTAPGPDPGAVANAVAWEWDPVIGINPDGPRLQRLGPDDFVAFQGPPQLYYGANVAIGRFE